MNTLSRPNTKSAGAAKRAARSGFRLRIGHVLVAAVVFSLLAWGALILLIKLVVTSLR